MTRANDEKRPKRSGRDSGRAPAVREKLRSTRSQGESREDFVVRGDVVETPEGFKLRY